MPIEHLPEKWRPAARDFRDWAATDKGLLLITFVGLLIRTSTYAFQEPWLTQHVLDVRTHFLSPLMWATATALVGIALIVESELMEAAALVAAVSVLMIWGVLFWWTSPGLFTGRGVLYVWVALLTGYTVWRGNSATIRVRGADGGPVEPRGRN